MAYAYARWDVLSAYLYDGNLLLDNNLVENAIRPVTLGRKNYLFAGSHEAARRAAMIYWFFAICKQHEVNPLQWLKHKLQINHVHKPQRICIRRTINELLGNQTCSS